MNIRPARVETDIPGITGLCNLLEPDTPETEDSLREQFLRQSPGRIDCRSVAVDEQDAVIGYSVIVHAGGMPDHHFYMWIGVLPGCRCQGIGSALWERGLAFLREQGATRVSGETLDGDPAGLAFAQRRGFTIDRHHFHSYLELATFDETPYLPIIHGLEAEGIRFCTLADLPDTIDTREAYCDLNLAAVRDIPGEVWDFSGYHDFFIERIWSGKWFRREGNLVALHGENMVGFATLHLRPETHEAYNATTGVIRAYRGRKIALALKVLATRYARANGALRMTTDNDSLNVPMLAVNRRMGYIPQSGKYILVRWMEQ
jgi:GNAT superfamily N-acetyltransferase